MQIFITKKLTFSEISTQEAGDKLTYHFCTLQYIFRVVQCKISKSYTFLHDLLDSHDLHDVDLHDLQNKIIKKFKQDNI